MKSLLIDLLQMTLSSGILYGYYYAFLRNKRFHQYNRFYLLIILVVSLLVPFLQIPVYFTNDQEPAVLFQTLQQMSFTGEDAAATYRPVSRSFDWSTVWYAVYGLMALLCLARIVLSLYRLKVLIKHNPVEELEGVYFVNTSEPGTPFSFFRWMFWDKQIDLHSEKGEQVFRHEIFHIQQKHSLDILFTELVTAICWFNPFFHLVKKELKAIHEFLADRFAATDESRKWEYAELLLMQALNTRHQLVNPFFHNQIKRRIAMITSSKKPSYQYLRKLLVLPIAALTIGLFAFQYKSRDNRLPINISISAAGTTGDTIPGKLQILPQTADTLFLRELKGTVKGIVIEEKEVKGEKTSSDTGRSETSNGMNALLLGKVVIGKPARNKGINSTTIEIDKKEPLFVIDGKVQDVTPNHKPLDNIRGEDIYAISVLKDQTALDKYGSRAINGVIEITTKKDRDSVRQEPGRLHNQNADVVVIGYRSKNGSPEPRDKTAGDDIIFSETEIAPSFPGGSEAWQQYLQQELDGSIPQRKNAPAGEYTVWVRFLVNKSGELSDIEALNRYGFGMEEEAIRVLKASPQWLPAIQNGRKVNAYRKQAVNFTVGNEIKIKGTAISGGLARLYPNPANQLVSLQFESVQAGEGLVTIADMSGKVQQLTRSSLVKGVNNIRLNTTSLKPGAYIVSVTDRNKKAIRSYKLIKE